MRVNAAGQFDKQITIIIFLYLLAILLLYPGWLIETDLFWHLKTGEDILAQHEFPKLDPYSYTVFGQPWMAKEWLSQVFLYLVYRISDWRGLTIINAICVATALSYFYYYYARFYRRTFVLGAIFLIMATMTLVVRPQTLTFPIFVIYLTSLDYCVRFRSRIPYWLMAFTVLWGNLHASAPLSLILIAFSALESIWHESGGKRLISTMHWVLFFSLNMISLGITPYGFDSLIFSIKFPSSGVQFAIVEWFSLPVAIVHSFNFLDVVIYVFVPSIILFYGVYVLTRPPVNWAGLLKIIFFAFSGFLHIRFIQVFSFITFATIFGNSYSRHGNISISDKLNDQFIKSNFLTWFASLGLIAVINLAFYVPNMPYRKSYPIEALRAAQHANLKGPVFNSYNFGGFLIFFNVKTFIDGRAELYLHSHFQIYNEALLGSDSDALLELLRNYGIQWAFVTSESPEDRNFARLVDWRLVYSDDIASVYVFDDKFKDSYNKPSL